MLLRRNLSEAVGFEGAGGPSHYSSLCSGFLFFWQPGSWSAFLGECGSTLVWSLRLEFAARAQRPDWWQTARLGRWSRKANERLLDVLCFSSIVFLAINKKHKICTLLFFPLLTDSSVVLNWIFADITVLLWPTNPFVSPSLHVIFHAYLMLNPTSLLSRCSVDFAGDWSAGSRLLLSQESASWGAGRFLRSPSLTLLSGRNPRAAIGVRGASSPVLLGSAPLISRLRRAQQLHSLSLLLRGPSWSPSTPPRHHGAVATATGWTVSRPHSVWLSCEDVTF